MARKKKAINIIDLMYVSAVYYLFVFDNTIVQKLIIMICVLLSLIVALIFQNPWEKGSVLSRLVLVGVVIDLVLNTAWNIFFEYMPFQKQTFLFLVNLIDSPLLAGGAVLVGYSTGVIIKYPGEMEQLVSIVCKNICYEALGFDECEAECNEET